MSGEKPESDMLGKPPRSGWARMVVELHVNDLKASLLFWQDVLGFKTAFDRPEERFVYLEHPEGHQIMLCQRHGRFETGPLNFPLGQGAMFQIYLASVEPVLSTLGAHHWPIYLGPGEMGGAGPEIVRAARGKFSCRTQTATCSWLRRT